MERDRSGVGDSLTIRRRRDPRWIEAGAFLTWDGAAGRSDGKETCILIRPVRLPLAVHRLSLRCRNG